MTQTNETQSAIQDAAFVQWQKNHRRGSIAGATGMGKSRVAVMAIEEILKEKKNAKIVVVVPTEELRDTNWPDEIQRWTNVSADAIQFVCYKSAPLVSCGTIDLLILDEVHRITELSGEIFLNNFVRHVLGLSATPPNPKRDLFKYQIIKDHCPVVFSYPLDQGVDDGVVADFHIVVVMEPLDNISKNIPGGTKKAPFMTTEAKQYAYLDSMTKRMMAMPPSANKDTAVKFALLKRMRFIYDLPSKTKLTEALLKQLDPGARILTFCGSIEQSRQLFGEDVYNSKDKKLGKLAEFRDGTIDRIGVVNAVDEGHNIPNLDIGIIVQANSNERSTIQRIGRVVRYRPGHKGLIFILCTQGTMDESWVRKALEGFDPQRVEYIPSREIYSGNLYSGVRNLAETS